MLELARDVFAAMVDQLFAEPWMIAVAGGVALGVGVAGIFLDQRP